MKPTKHKNNHVVVCIPYFKCRQYIRRAVLSILEQTHKNLTVVVVNDADFETPPWTELTDITDPRLVRFDLTENQSLYFANGLVHSTIEAPYFLVQDADDWSHPERIERLLGAMVMENSDVAFGSEVQFQEHVNGSYEVLGIRYRNLVHHPSRITGKDMETVCPHLDESYKFRITHHALFRSSTLTSLGGYYAGMRQHFDTLITNLVLMVGKVSHVDQPLYWRLHWPGAITKHPKTRFGTEVSKTGIKTGEQLYRLAYSEYMNYLGGHKNAQGLTHSIRSICHNNIPGDKRQKFQMEQERLRALLN